MAQILLTELVLILLIELRKMRYAELTLSCFKREFDGLVKFSEDRGCLYYSPQIGKEYVESTTVRGKAETLHNRVLRRRRCIQFIESYLNFGVINTKCIITKNARLERIPSVFRSTYDRFVDYLKGEGLKPKTIAGYTYIVSYFLKYLGEQGYSSLKDIQKGDVQGFIRSFVYETCKPTSLRGIITGLSRFLSLNKITRKFLNEIPEKLPQKREILEVYSDEEYNKIMNYLEASLEVS